MALTGHVRAFLSSSLSACIPIEGANRKKQIQKYHEPKCVYLVSDTIHLSTKTLQNPSRPTWMVETIANYLLPLQNKTTPVCVDLRHKFQKNCSLPFFKLVELPAFCCCFPSLSFSTVLLFFSFFSSSSSSLSSSPPNLRNLMKPGIFWRFYWISESLESLERCYIHI